MTFNFIFDAGHGWLEVSERTLASVGLSEGDFSAYSYREGDKLYLEEDLDAMVFLRAWEAEHGEPSIREIDHGDYSRVRTLHSVRPRVAEDEIMF